MRIPIATLVLFAISITTIDAANRNIKNQQGEGTREQPSDIFKLWDCALPTCRWGACAELLRYNGDSCIKSFQSLTNSDW